MGLLGIISGVPPSRSPLPPLRTVVQRRLGRFPPPSPGAVPHPPIHSSIQRAISTTGTVLRVFSAAGAESAGNTP